MKTLIQFTLVCVLFVVPTAGQLVLGADDQKDTPTAQSPSAAAEPAKAEKAKPDQPKGDQKKSEPPPPSAPQPKVMSWEADVLMPVVRLLGIAAVLTGLIWGMNLRSVLLAESWSERTVVAFGAAQAPEQARLA